MDLAIKISDPCKDSLDTWAKIFCIKTVYTGVLKQISNNASIAFYNSVLQSVRDYHKTVLAGVEIHKCKLVPIPKVLLNVNNITIVQNAILENIKTVINQIILNPYRILKSYKGKYFSIMHDGIHKFSKELPGTFIQTATTASKSTEIVNVSWRLNQVHGGPLNTDN